MRKIIRIFAIVLATIVLLIAGLLLWLRNADLSAYQGHVETFVSNRIGHQLTIGGRFELQFGRSTTVVAENVSLTNPEWPTETNLVSVAHLTVVFDTWSIFDKPFVIEELYVDDIRAHVLREDGGQVNWAAEIPGREDAEPGEFDINRIAFRSVSLNGVEVTYIDPARPRPVVMTLESLTVRPDATDILDLDLTGTVNELPLWADGKLGPWQNFIDGQDIFADFDVTLGPLRLSLDGTIADLVRLEGVQLNGALSGPDISRVLERLTLPPFASGEFEILANVEQFENGHQLRLDGNLGQIDLFISGSLDRLLRPQSVRHDFSVSGPDVGPVAELFGIRNVPAVPFLVAGDYTREGLLMTFGDAIARVGANSISFTGNVDLSIPVPDWELEIDASGPDFAVLGPFISVDGLPQEPFTATGYVSKTGRVWESRQLVFHVGENRLRVNGRLETGSIGTAEIDIRASGPDISIIQDFTDLQGIPARPFDILAVIRPDPLGIRVDDGSAVFGDNRLEVEGVVALQEGLDGSVLDVATSGPDLHNIALLTDVPYLPPGPFNASGRILFEDGSLILERVRGNVAQMEALVSGAIAIFGEQPGEFDLDIDLAGPDLGVIPEIEAIDQLTGEPFSFDGKLAYADGTLSATEADVALGSLQARVDGSLAGAGQLADVTIAATSSDSIVLRKLTKLAYLPEGAVRIDGKIEKTETEIRFTDTTLGVGEFAFTANGALNLSPRRNDSDLSFEMSGPNLAEVGEVFGNTLLPEKAFTFAGEFEGTPSGFALRPFTATLDETDLTGEFEADLTGKPRINGVLASQYLDLSYTPRKTDLPVEGDGMPEVDRSNRFFSTDPLRTSWLQKADVDIQLDVGSLVANTLYVTDVEIGFDLLDGALTIDPFVLREGTGSVNGEFLLHPQDAGYLMQGALTVDQMHVGLMVADDQPVEELPTLSGEMRLEGRGNSVRELMASANGVISFRQGSGKVKEMFGSVLFKDVFLQVLRTLNPMRRARDYQVLECGIYNVTIKDGMATIDKFVIQTDTMTTVARGEVNLANERMEIAFRAAPREGIGISLGTVANRLLEVRGTLKEPRVRIDAGRTATTTGAAVATGGLSLLARGLWDRLSAEADACKKKD